jgi:ribose/xylose/arabinose/galactoside ABC-type transport system permease subunit
MIGRLLRNDDVLRLIVLVALVIAFGLLTNGVTYSALGMRNILQQSAIVGIAAIGQAFVILTGAIDVSLYGIGVLASVLGASALTNRFDLNLFGGDPSSIWTGAGIMLAVGALMGAVNGALVAWGRIPSLVATLGTWQIGFGIAQLIGGGYTITDLSPDFGVFGQSSVAGVPAPILEMLVLFLIAAYVLHHTSFGRSIYAVGGNAASAYLSGIKVQRIQFAVFVISGIMVSLAAISITSRMMAVSTRTLTGLQIDSIAAVTVGGVSIFGGKGTILGVLIGTLILAVIDSGLGAIGATTDVQNTVKGAIIIVAASIEYFRPRLQLSRAAA